MPDEIVVWQRRVSLGRCSGATDVRTAAVGALCITSSGRVLFAPGRGNRRRYRKAREWPLADVVSVGEQPRDFTPYTGGMQKRLRLDLRNGTALLFVLVRRDEAIAELSRLVAERASSENPDLSPGGRADRPRDD